MRVFALGLSVLLCTVAGFSQSTSVMIEELTTNEVADAIASGKTTAIYYVGGAHQNGDAVAIGKHNALAGHLARRVAEELGNALSYPVNPYAPAGDPVEKTGHMRFPGTHQRERGNVRSRFERRGPECDRSRLHACGAHG